MRHFWQWFCGYICICVNGRQVNRFLNLCSRNGIHLWRITYDLEHTLRANIRLRDFYDLKPYLRKTKTQLKILSKKGFPFWCHRHPRMKWFLCFCICIISIWFYSFNFIWNIEVTGNTIVSTQEIIHCLHKNNVDTGLKKNVIDCTEIEVLLREQFHQLGWVSVYIKNTNLYIEVKESLYDTVEHQGIEYGVQHNIVANKDATIYSIVTRAGNSIVKKGDSVKKGDILILGKNDIYDDSGVVKDTLYFKATAEIWADVSYNIDIPISEMEIMSLKIAGNYEDESLYKIGYRKLQRYIDYLESKGIIILNSDIILDKQEKNICFRARIYAREQFGISIPVEEILENEFE